MKGLRTSVRNVHVLERPEQHRLYIYIYIVLSVPSLFTRLNKYCLEAAARGCVMARRASIACMVNCLNTTRVKCEEKGRRGSIACMVDCAIRCVELLTAGAV